MRARAWGRSDHTHSEMPDWQHIASIVDSVADFVSDTRQSGRGADDPELVDLLARGTRGRTR